MSTQAPSSKTPEPTRPRERDAGPAPTRPDDDRLRSATGRAAEPGRNAGHASDDTRQATE